MSLADSFMIGEEPNLGMAPPELPSTLLACCFADQMTSVRTWLNETCGIPASDIVGMRNPYLINSPGTREVGELAWQAVQGGVLSCTGLCSV